MSLQSSQVAEENVPYYIVFAFREGHILLHEAQAQKHHQWSILVSTRRTKMGENFILILNPIWVGGGTPPTGYPDGSNMRAKSLTKKVAHCNMLHITFGYFFCWNIIFWARYKVRNQFWGTGTSTLIYIYV